MNKIKIALLALLSLLSITSLYMAITGSIFFWIPIILGLISIIVFTLRNTIISLLFTITSAVSAIIISYIKYNSLNTTDKEMYFILSIAIIITATVVSYRVLIKHTKYKIWTIFLVQTFCNISLMPYIINNQNHTLIIIGFFQIMIPALALLITWLKNLILPTKQNQVEVPEKLLSSLNLTQLKNHLGALKGGTIQKDSHLIEYYNKSKKIYIVKTLKPIKIHSSALSVNGRNVTDEIKNIIKYVQNRIGSEGKFYYTPLTIILWSSKSDLPEPLTVEFKEEKLKDREPHNLIVASNLNAILR